MGPLSATLVEEGSTVNQRSDAVQSFIMHHVVDSHVWSPFPGVNISLPSWLSLHEGMLIFCAAIVLGLVLLARRKRAEEVPTGLANVLELYVAFIRNHIAVEYLGEKDGLRYTPLFCTYFLFILTMNLVGLIPCFATATSNLGVTSALAGVTFLFMVVGGLYRLGPVQFFKLFVPPGIPWPLLLLLVPIEIIGVFIKTFALMIRLFANMLAGHIVIFSLLGLLVIFGYWALPSLAVAVCIYVLEVFVAFLQAYIFTLLSAVFIGQCYHPQH